MGDTTGTVESTVETKAANTPTTTPAVTRQLPAVLAGADTLMNGKLRIGVEVRVKSGSGSSALRIADVTRISKGEPVYIAKPIRLEGYNLRKFLIGKGILHEKADTEKDDKGQEIKGPDGKPKKQLEEAYGRLIDDATISCQAFYFTAGDNPLLMMFDLQLKNGLIESLTGDKDLGDLFDITGASVRLLRCKEEDFPKLQAYAAQLAED
ncbi:hypothetical protein IT404_08100 [Candidatus Nomurabacteria bacterium]|nr:hypothetical protein [Candidatus Nomurabacteria bacterium]